MKQRHYVMIGLAAILASEIEAIGPFTSALNFAGNFLVGLYMGWGIKYIVNDPKKVLKKDLLDEIEEEINVSTREGQYLPFSMSKEECVNLGYELAKKDIMALLASTKEIKN